MPGRSPRIGPLPSDRLVFPLDVATAADAEALIELLHAEVGVFKVGLELFTAVGPAALQAVHARKRQSFLDLKLHDIPATVQHAVEAALRLGATYLTLHAAAGPEMLRAATRVAEGTPLQLLAVTVLTSMNDATLTSVGLQGPTSAAVERLAALAIDSGVNGLVCSPAECMALRARFGNDVLLVTPGIRPTGSANADQKRVATPGDALAAGADLIVVGRPIREALEPRRAAQSVLQEIAQALS
jgi:orotidine-5'-phosphate decarboxylase